MKKSILLTTFSVGILLGSLASANMIGEKSNGAGVIAKGIRCEECEKNAHNGSLVVDTNPDSVQHPETFSNGATRE